MDDDVPSRLLLKVLLAAVHDLLHHTQVVLRAGAEGRREVAGLLEQRLARSGGLFEELGRERVELLETARLVVQEAADGAVGAALLVEELDEGLLGALTVVVDRRVCREQENKYAWVSGADVRRGKMCVPFWPLGKNMIVGKLPISYLVASGRLFWASASTFATTHWKDGEGRA